MRDRDKEYQRRHVQPLIVMAQQTFQLKHPKVFVKLNEDAWSWPDTIPAEVLFDPLSTVSATYSVAFQTQFRGGANVWSSRPVVFVIDRDGVLRHVDSRPDEDIREEGIFPVVDDLEEQRQLITALQPKDEERHKAARAVLAPLDSRTATVIPALVKSLKDEEAHVRAGAAAALLWVASWAEPAIPALTEALQDGDPRVRRFAVMTLARIGPGAKPAVSTLIHRLKDEDTAVRAAVREALGMIGLDAKVSVPALLSALKDTNPNVRLLAARSLGQLGTAAKDAVPALTEALKDENTDVRQEVTDALKKIDAANKVGRLK